MKTNDVCCWLGGFPSTWTNEDEKKRAFLSNSLWLTLFLRFENIWRFAFQKLLVGF
jgi:hypothetical protein